MKKILKYLVVVIIIVEFLYIGHKIWDFLMKTAKEGRDEVIVSFDLINGAFRNGNMELYNSAIEGFEAAYDKLKYNLAMIVKNKSELDKISEYHNLLVSEKSEIEEFFALKKALVGGYEKIELEAMQQRFDQVGEKLKGEFKNLTEVVRIRDSVDEISKILKGLERCLKEYCKEELYNQTNQEIEQKIQEIETGMKEINEKMVNKYYLKFNENFRV